MSEDRGRVDKDCYVDDISISSALGVNGEEREVGHVYCAGRFAREVWREWRRGGEDGDLVYECCGGELLEG